MSAPAEGTWLRIVRGERRRPTDWLAAAGLRLLSMGYGAALAAHVAAYRWGLAKSTRLPALTVSIGNLTVGGTGKTTSCLAVASWLQSRGRQVAVLSRGYRGAGETGAVIVSEGHGPQVEVLAAGDEPYLLAQTLPQVGVVVGRDRRITGRLAVERLGADAVVLDDGFQYRRLTRDLDIVLVDALAPFGYDSLVPRGLLREPVSHLARADAVWLTHADLVSDDSLAAIRARVQEAAPRARVWQTVHAPVAVRRLGTEERLRPQALAGRRVCALSGLGSPLAFERSLVGLGADLVSTARFPDHHRYSADELRAVAETAGAAEWIVTTAKDAVRLPATPAKPTWVLEIELAAQAGCPPLSEEMECLLRAKSIALG